MLKIKKNYVTDENKRPYAAQVDLETFERMENLIEDYALGQLMDENDPADHLTLKEAEAYYRKLKKS